jgi:hypothetical protein
MLRQPFLGRLRRWPGRHTQPLDLKVETTGAKTAEVSDAVADVDVRPTIQGLLKKVAFGGFLRPPQAGV